MTADANIPRAGLFRTEAIQHRAVRLDGVVIIRNAAWHLAATAVSFVCLAVLLWGLLATSYAPRHTVPGYLAPETGLVRVMPARAGILQNIEVSDGQVVNAGQAIAVISVEQGLSVTGRESTPGRMLAELRQREASLTKELDREERVSNSQSSRLEKRIADLRKALTQLDSEVSILEKRVATNEELLAKTESLRKQGYVTGTEVAFRKDQVLALQKDWYALTRAETALSTELSEAESDLKQRPLLLEQRRTAISNQLSELRQGIAALEVERSYTITAPVGGTVTALQADVGAPVTPSQPILALMPQSSKLEARLMVPSRAVGFTQPSSLVRLRYQAYPHEQYGAYEGTVVEVSKTSLQPHEWPATLPATEPMYRIKVRLDQQVVTVGGKPRPLQAGLLLEADLLEEPRPLWAWLFRPVLAMRGRL